MDVIGEGGGVAIGVNNLREKDVAGGAGRAIGLAEDEFGAVAREHFVAGGPGAGEEGLIQLLEGVSLGVGVEAGEGALAAAAHVIIDIGQGIHGIVRDVGDPIAGPFGTEVGIGKVGGLEGIAVIVADDEPDRRADGRGIADGLVSQIQIDQHQVNAGNRHARRAAGTTAGTIATRRRSFGVGRSGILGVVAARDTPAPDGAGFRDGDSAPARGQRPGGDQKVTAGLGLERLAGGPNLVAEGGVLEQIVVAVLADHGGVMAGLPVDDGGNHEGAAICAEGYLVIEADLAREFGDLRKGEAFLGGGGVEYFRVGGRLRLQRELDALEGEGAATEGDVGAVLHGPKGLARAGDSFAGGAGEGAVGDGF